MRVLCNLASKKIEGFVRWGEITHNPLTHVVLTVTYYPNVDNERLNNTNNGLRLITQIERDAEITEKLEKDADIEARFDSTLRAFALVLISEINILRVSAGLPVRTIQQLKDAVKAKL